MYCCGCGLFKAPEMFSTKAREKYFSESHQVTCLECTGKDINAKIAGFRKDAKCSKCEKELANKMFRTRPGQRMTKCKDCEVLSCKACGKEQPGNNFDEQTKQNYFVQGQEAVCDVCKSKGCSIAKPRMYRCATCKKNWGWKKFCKDDLNAYAQASQGAKLDLKLLCSQCLANFVE